MSKNTLKRALSRPRLVSRAQPSVIDPDASHVIRRNCYIGPTNVSDRRRELAKDLWNSIRSLRQSGRTSNRLSVPSTKGAESTLAWSALDRSAVRSSHRAQNLGPSEYVALFDDLCP